MKKFILYKLILHNCKDKNHLEKGFTLIEVISTLVMSSIVVLAGFAGFFQIKEFFGTSKVDVDVTQRLRTAFQSMGPDLQQLGEGISKKEFPVVALSNSNGTSEITIRKGGFTTLTLCGDLKKGSTDVVKVLDNGLTTLPACVSPNDTNNDGWPDGVKDWQNHRNGNTVKAYILDTKTSKGESFDYSGEETFDASGVSITPVAGSETRKVNLTTNNHTWANDYEAATTAIYLFDEKTYKVTNNTLQLISNGEVFDLVENIEKLDLTGILQDDVSATISRCKTIDLTGAKDCTPALSTDYTWNQIKSVEVTVTSLPSETEQPPKTQAEKEEKEKLRSLTQQFLPRNRLSF